MTSIKIYIGDAYIYINLNDTEASNIISKMLLSRQHSYQIFSENLLTNADTYPNKKNEYYQKVYQQKIIKLFKSLRALGYKHPFKFPKVFTQSDLNIYHRFFTYSNVWIQSLKNHQSVEANRYYPKYDITNLKTARRKELFDYIGKTINFYIHKMETVSYDTPTQRLLRIKNLSGNRFHINPFEKDVCDPTNTARNNIGRIWYGLKDLTVNYSYLKDSCDVILTEEILGKSIIRSYTDEDDPNDVDTMSGHTGTFGGFGIDIGNWRREIYETEHFHSWLKFHNLNIDQVPLEYPIGKVNIERSTVDYSSLDRVELDTNLLRYEIKENDK